MSLGKAAIKSAEATQIFFDMLEQSGDDSDQDSVNKIANDSEPDDAPAIPIQELEELEVIPRM